MRMSDLSSDVCSSDLLIGPNGAGNSTVLHSIFGFTNVFSGTVSVDGRDVTRLSPQEKLKAAGIAYILQDKSVFPGMTVEENLLMGGFLKNSVDEAREPTARVLAKYDHLAPRPRQPAGRPPGGGGRPLGVSRHLVLA